MDDENWPFGPNFGPSGDASGDANGGPEGLDLNALFAMLQSQSTGPVNWDAARQIAAQICTQDPDEFRDSDGMQLAVNDPNAQHQRPDPAVDPQRAAYIDALVLAAQANVAATTGLAESTSVPTRSVTRHDWTIVTLDGLKPVLESLAGRMSTNMGVASMPDGFGGDENAEMMGQILGSITPMLFGFQAGSLAGLLSHHALGQYDLPLPLAATPQLAFVVSNIEQFAHDWSLPFDELSYALVVRETVHAAQRSVPWVRERLVRLATEYVDGYELRVEAFEAQLPEEFTELDAGNGEFNPFELIEKMQSGELPGLQIEPTELLAGMRTERQGPVLELLQRFGAILEGYADAIIDTVSGHSGPNQSRIEEALRRHRVERGAAADFVDLMLGLQLGREDYERGHAFCAGVIERAGIDALNRLWERETHLPTPAEFEAPGLWLARLELNLDDQ